jgi:hypothetical protein
MPCAILGISWGDLIFTQKDLATKCTKITIKMPINVAQNILTPGAIFDNSLKLL